MLKFELTEQEAQVVLNAIAKEPLGQVIEVFNKIQFQASKQMESQIDKNPFFAEPNEGQGNGI